jgi:predicted RNA-binding Zn-ribbon protein involved in translation (DUF1610 family)
VDGTPSDNLYICGLPSEFDTNSVQQFFSAVGNVIQCKSFGHGYALVRLSCLEESSKVKAILNGQKITGCAKPLVITYATSEKKDDWYCPRCGDLQFQKNSQCRMCGSQRPKQGEAVVLANTDMATGPPPPGLPHYAEDGDWKCLKCGDLQFKRNLSCRLCGTPAPGQPGAPDPATTPPPTFGKAKGKGSKGGKIVGGGASPYSGKAKSKGGALCSMAEFIQDLVRGGLPGGDFDYEKNTLYVGGLPPDCKNRNLYEIFATFGPMPPRGARAQLNTTGDCAGFGHVNFLESSAADMAILALNGIQLADGQQLEVRWKNDKMNSGG